MIWYPKGGAQISLQNIFITVRTLVLTDSMAVMVWIWTVSSKAPVDLFNQCFNPLMDWKLDGLLTTGWSCGRWGLMGGSGPLGMVLKDRPCLRSLCLSASWPSWGENLGPPHYNSSSRMCFLSQIKDKIFGGSSSITHLDSFLSLLIIFESKFRA